MPVTVDAAPASITRVQYRDLIAGAGFDPADLVSLEFRADGVYAVVFAKGENGKHVIDGEDVVKHRVFVPVQD